MNEKKIKISPYCYAGIRISDLPLQIRRVIRMRTRIYSQAIISDAIEKVTGIGFSMLANKTRKHSVVFARHIYCYQMRDKTNLSLKEIGQMLGGRDHTTVVNSVRVYHNLNETDDAFYQLALKIEDEIDRVSSDANFQKSTDVNVS